MNRKIILAFCFVLFFSFIKVNAQAEDFSTGLIGHWSFDSQEDSLLIDNSVNENNGSIIGSPIQTDGIMDRSLSFDGIDDIIDINIDITKRILDRNHPFTVSFWGKFFDDDNGNVVISLGSVRDGETLVVNYQAEYNRFLFDDQTKPGYTRLPFVPNGDWQHIVWTSDGLGKHTVYVDARQKTEIDNPGGSGSSISEKFYIGGRPTDLFNGSLDDLRVYERELSSAEVIDLYESSSGRTIEMPTIPVPKYHSGLYSQPVIMEISHKEDETVYYTIDGSEPDVNSNKYTGPFLITEDAFLKIKSFNGFLSQTVPVDLQFDQSFTSTTADTDSVLPQKLTHHIILRNWLKTLKTEDFEVSLGPVLWQDDFADNVDDVFNIYNIFGENALEMASTSAIRLAPQFFTLESIEANGKINMTKDSADPLGAVWWASWDYQGNPFGPKTNNSEAILRRALVVGAVDLIMHENYWGDNGGRSDFIGGHLIWQVMPFYKGKHLLPVDVRMAYETSLRRLFERLEQKYPSGTGGKDMETPQIVSMWHIAESLDDDDLRSRWKQRAMYVLDKIMTADGATHVHGSGTDISYDGIWQYFMVWATSISNDPDLLSYLEKVNELKGELSFPEPTILQSSGPNNWNTGTALDATSDQWRTQFRDLLTSKIVKNALYLPTIRGVSWADNGVPKTESQLRAQLHTFDERATNFYKTTEINNTAPFVWINESHWITRSNYLLDYDMGNFYSKLLKLHENKNEMLKAPVLRNRNYIKKYGQEFLTFKSDSFAGSIHFGQIENSWAGNVSGLSGGGLSSFWTAQGGSVIQGKNRGSQNGINADSWTSVLNGPLYWSVHSVLGRSQEGYFFSSARILNPNREVKVNDKGNQAIIKINGKIGQTETDPNNIVQSEIDYSRSFFVNRKGVFVKTQISSNGQEKIQDLYEMIPLFSSHSGQSEATNAKLKVSFRVNNVWIETANSDFVENVESVRLERFGNFVYINFDKPQKIGLSDRIWQTWNARLINLMIDIGNGSGFVPVDTDVSYTVTTVEDFRISESLLDSF